MDYVTKEDLKHQTETIKEHINLLIAPIIEKQDDMKTVLHGKTGINGVVGCLKSTVNHLKIMKVKIYVVYVLLVGVFGLLVKLLFFKPV